MRKAELHHHERPRLEQLAARALARGCKSADILIVCIDADAPVWRSLADGLMPGTDWEHVRRTKGAPVARGSVLREGVADYIAEIVPGVAWALKRRPRPGTVHAVVCAEDGADVYEIEPRPEPD